MHFTKIPCDFAVAAPKVTLGVHKNNRIGVYLFKICRELQSLGLGVEFQSIVVRQHWDRVFYCMVSEAFVWLEWMPDIKWFGPSTREVSFHFEFRSGLCDTPPLPRCHPQTHLLHLLPAIVVHFAKLMMG